MGTLRRLVSHLGILILVLSMVLVWAASPARAAGTPPIIRTFNAHAENQVGFASPHLGVDVQVDDPDGQVPLTIQSVMVTGPDGRTFDLTNLFRYPNLNFRGGYFPDLGTPVPTGTYRVDVTDIQGNTVTATDVLNPFPSLLPANVTSPGPEQILTTTTPTFHWDPIVSAGSVRVLIRNADQGHTSGDGLYTGPFLSSLSGPPTQFTLPAGVLEPGRRYALRLEAFDTSTGLPTANIRAATHRNFSVAGPNVSLFLNQSTFHLGQTLKLGANIRNDGAPVKVGLKFWAGVPTIPDPVELADVDVDLPSTAPDVSIVANDLVVLTFTTVFPAGDYVFGMRFSAGKTDGIIAQSRVGFHYSPE